MTTAKQERQDAGHAGAIADRRVKSTFVGYEHSSVAQNGAYREAQDQFVCPFPVKRVIQVLGEVQEKFSIAGQPVAGDGRGVPAIAPYRGRRSVDELMQVLITCCLQETDEERADAGGA